MLSVAPSLLTPLINAGQSCPTVPGICGRGSIPIPAGSGNVNVWLCRGFWWFCFLFFLYLRLSGLPLLSPGAAPPALRSRARGLGEPFSLHQQLSIGNPACPGARANKRSRKKYHRGFFYFMTAQLPVYISFASRVWHRVSV